MAREIDEYVARNTEKLRNVDTRFTQVDSNRNRDISFGGNLIDVTVEVELYKRSTGDQLVFGHPDASKGFGRGTFGDDRGAWSLLTDAEASEEFTRDGRRAVVEAYDADLGAITEAGVGTDTTVASTTDTALQDETGRSDAFSTHASNVVTSIGIFASTEVLEEPGEVGVFDGDDRLLARVTVDQSTFDVADTDEVKALIILTFSGDGKGQSVVTDAGEEEFARAIATPGLITAPDEIRFGSGSTDFTESDTALTTQEITKPVFRDLGRDSMTIGTRVGESSMSTLTNDLTEIGVFDDGRMIWGTTMQAIPSDSPGFDADAELKVR